MIQFIRERPLNALGILLIFAVFACILFACGTPWYWVLVVLAALAVLVGMQKG